MMGARRGWREGKAQSGEKAESFHGSLLGDTGRLYRVHSRKVRLQPDTPRGGDFLALLSRFRKDSRDAH